MLDEAADETELTVLDEELSAGADELDKAGWLLILEVLEALEVLEVLEVPAVLESFESVQ